MHETINNVVTGKVNGEIESLLIGHQSDIDFKTRLRETIKSYTNVKVTDKVLGTERHIPVGLMLNNLLALREYENVLFIPSFRNNKFPNMLDEGYNVQESNISQHMMPIINKHFDASPNVYVAYPEGHSSVYHDLMLEFGVNIIPSSGMYSMGDDSYTVTPPAGLSFDCVYLAGHDIAEGVTFSAEDIKEDFNSQSFCVDGFDLIDDYQDHNLRLEVHRGNPLPDVTERLTGTQKNIDDILEYIGNNTIRPDGFENEQFKRTIQGQISVLMKTAIKVY